MDEGGGVAGYSKLSKVIQLAHQKLTVDLDLLGKRFRVIIQYIYYGLLAVYWSTGVD